MPSGLGNFVARPKPENTGPAQASANVPSMATRRELAQNAKVPVMELSSEYRPMGGKAQAAFGKHAGGATKAQNINLPADVAAAAQEPVPDADIDDYETTNSSNVDQYEDAGIHDGDLARTIMYDVHEGEHLGQQDAVPHRAGVEHYDRVNTPLGQQLNEAAVTEVFRQAQQQRGMSRRPQTGVPLDTNIFADMSYPTTTSGHLDEDDDFGHDPRAHGPEERLDYDPEDAAHVARDIVRNNGQGFYPGHATPPGFRGPTLAQQRAPPARSVTYEQGARLREIERSKAGDDNDGSSQNRPVFTYQKGPADTPRHVDLDMGTTVERHAQPPTVLFKENPQARNTAAGTMADGRQQARRSLPRDTNRVERSRKPQPKPFPAPQARSEFHLDYDLDKLRGMSFSELQREPFDHDPNGPSPALPNSDSTASLPDRLSLAAGLEQDEQHNFFNSLSIDEWEDAGDWFLEQFGGLIKKMKEARRQKRGLAASFETELSERDEMVGIKRREVEDALGSMKKGGMGLLSATPRKESH